MIKAQGGKHTTKIILVLKAQGSKRTNKILLVLKAQGSKHTNKIMLVFLLYLHNIAYSTRYLSKTEGPDDMLTGHIFYLIPLLFVWLSRPTYDATMDSFRHGRIKPIVNCHPRRRYWKTSMTMMKTMTMTMTRLTRQLESIHLPQFPTLKFFPPKEELRRM